ncbi:hypothetical protein phytr_5540 [Candidatus Phycorickettsia trachydisci]|uniref:Uncharacterized protein n=1 Tax=Candidatus Phycorickettsia trachydisci TaxID=2115978 RepID=A0A2P1P899_9RICK|nr:hypothetical protein [Candidatus Phycorickettsia trachydisci]AVP87499.1 hypothetical protein phytr_5540 [Candidatus Phycorickettsia trachydisci]
MDKLPGNKFINLNLLKNYYIDGSFGDVLILMFIHAGHNPQYLEAAQYIYEHFKSEPGSEESMKVIFKIVLMNICHMVNHCSDEGHPKRITLERFTEIFNFLCGKYDVEAESFLELIKPCKVEFRDICLEKARKAQKYLGEPAEVVFIPLNHLIDFDHVANIMYKFIACQSLSTDEIDELLTKRIDLVGFKFITHEAKRMVKRNSIVMTVDFFAQLADNKTFKWFIENIKMRPIYVDCKLRLQTRIAKDLFTEGHFSDCQKAVAKMDSLLEDLEFDGIDDMRSKLTTFNALNFKAEYYFACNNILEGIYSLLASYKLSPEDAFTNTHTWVLNLRFLDPLKRKEVLDQFKINWPIPGELKMKLLRFFKKGYELFEEPSNQNFKEYEKIKERLGEFSEFRLNEAINQIFITHSLYFYASCNKMKEVYDLLGILKSRSYILDQEYSLTILDILYNIPTDQKLFNMLEKSNFFSLEVLPNILAWEVYLKLSQQTLDVRYWNKAMYYLDKANSIFYANSEVLKNFKNLIISSNKITVIEANKVGIKCYKFFNLISKISSYEDFKKFEEYLNGLHQKVLEKDTDRDEFTIYRDERDAYYGELVRENASLTRNLRVIKNNVSHWRIGDKLVSSKDLDSLKIADNKIFVLIDSALSSKEIAKLYKALEAGMSLDTTSLKLSLSKDILEKINVAKIYTDYSTGDELIYLATSKSPDTPSSDIETDASNQKIESSVDEIIAEKLGDSVTKDFDAYY